MLGIFDHLSEVVRKFRHADPWLKLGVGVVVVLVAGAALPDTMRIGVPDSTVTTVANADTTGPVRDALHDDSDAFLASWRRFTHDDPDFVLDSLGEGSSSALIGETGSGAVLTLFVSGSGSVNRATLIQAIPSTDEEWERALRGLVIFLAAVEESTTLDRPAEGAIELISMFSDDLDPAWSGEKATFRLLIGPETLFTVEARP